MLRSCRSADVEFERSASGWGNPSPKKIYMPPGGMLGMEQHGTPYVWRDEPGALPEQEFEDELATTQETVIVDGQAMSYREYRETLRKEK